MATIPSNERTIVEIFDREFVSLIESLRSLTESVPPDLLYRPVSSYTVGENILKSAGIVEQTFGGITMNLWDNPYEWTLPETLSTPELVREYLSEVEVAKTRGIASLSDDGMLLKYIAMPSGNPCRIVQLFLETLTRASDYRGRAVAARKMLFDVSRPGFII